MNTTHDAMSGHELVWHPKTVQYPPRAEVSQTRLPCAEQSVDCAHASPILGAQPEASKSDATATTQGRASEASDNCGTDAAGRAGGTNKCLIGRPDRSRERAVAPSRHSPREARGRPYLRAAAPNAPPSQKDR